MPSFLYMLHQPVQSYSFLPNKPRAIVKNTKLGAIAPNNGGNP